jgi:hypothetical protein
MMNVTILYCKVPPVPTVRIHTEAKPITTTTAGAAAAAAAAVTVATVTAAMMTSGLVEEAVGVAGARESVMTIATDTGIGRVVAVAGGEGVTMTIETAEIGTEAVTARDANKKDKINRYQLYVRTINFIPAEEGSR